MKKIELVGKYGTGKFALVDDDDYEKLNQYKWHVYKIGYIYARVSKKYTYMHRLIMNAPKGIEVDHINHDKFDNQKSNLRLCTRQQNIHNKKPNKNKTSKYKGVRWHKGNKSWQSKISYDGKRYYLGYFNTEAEAAHAYNIKATELFGEFAFLNEINCECANPKLVQKGSCTPKVCVVCGFEAKPHADCNKFNVISPTCC